MVDELFDSLNPYQQIVTIRTRDEKEMAEKLAAIRTPWKLLSPIVATPSNRFVAFVVGDIRKKPGPKPKPKPKDEGNK